ncbi:MAG: hypothetical protein RH917_13790 [Lacipirellulaceae bacterium]
MGLTVVSIGATALGAAQLLEQPAGWTQIAHISLALEGGATRRLTLVGSGRALLAVH